MRHPLSVGLFAICAFAQAGPKFEVASVKPAGPDHDGPPQFHNDPERIAIDRATLLGMIKSAYDPTSGYDAVHMLDWDQISGPAWIATEPYSVEVKIPPGTTKEQLRLMWQNLLAERFHLQVHFGSKEFTVYELTLAKAGPKFRKAGEGACPSEPGFPAPTSGAKRAMSYGPPRNTRQTFCDSSMVELAERLSWPLSEISGQVYAGHFTLGKVVDRTGLEGYYDFTLEYAGRPAQGGSHPEPLPEGEVDTAPNLFDALRQQLGLVLVEKKTKLDVLIVDHVDRVPTEN